MAGTSDEREALAGEMEAALRRHVMDAWFPRCLDQEHGGFHCDFDRQWRLAGPQTRMLEFQARQTRAAARLALAYPAEGDWAEYALHGFRFLRNTGWDRDEPGGWFWLQAPDGRPLEGGTKHAHSGTYAVQACALVHASTSEPGALELAMAGFEWFERFAHDPEHGGYHNWFLRDGTVIRGVEQLPPGTRREDPMNHALGLKDTNVNGDWFETLTELAILMPEPRILVRLRELAQVYLDHLTTAEGRVNFSFLPDWTVLPGQEVHGYGLQAVHRLLTAQPLLPDMPLSERAWQVLRRAVLGGRRRGGGVASEFREGVSRVSPLQHYRHRRRAWWPQFEALRVLARVSLESGPRGEAAWRLVQRQWRFIQREFLDEEYGGVYGTAPDDLLPWHRPGRWRRERWLAKGNNAKDASHDADGLLKAIEALRAS
jgi:mannobiose 2-epimerase